MEEVWAERRMSRRMAMCWIMSLFNTERGRKGRKEKRRWRKKKNRGRAKETRDQISNLEKE
jgi:hypothetical protein